MNLRSICGNGLAALIFAAGPMLAGVSRGEQVVSRPFTLQSPGDASAPTGHSEGRAFSLQIAGPVPGPPDASLARLFTLQNTGVPATPPNASMARASTLLNLGEVAPPQDNAIAQAFTAQNLIPELADAYPRNRSFTTFNLPVAGPLAGEAGLGRAFTARQLTQSMALSPSEAFARAITLQNLGILDEPGVDEVVGRPFTVQNAGDVIDIPETPGKLLPKAFQLYANTPNPFRHTTAIRYDLPHTASISIRIYDVAGRLVRILVHSKKHEPGRFVIDWNGQDQDGRPLPSGVYFYRMRTDSYQQNQRLVMVRE